MNFRKKYVLLLSILMGGVIGAVVFNFADPSASILQSELVVQGAWGIGENDFGLISDENGELPCGPSTFCIDKIGNIYIADVVNARLKKYNSNGMLSSTKSTSDIYSYIDDMAINDSNMLFLLARKMPRGYLSIVMMDAEFNVIKECTVRNLLGDMVDNYVGIKINTADNDGVYLSGLSNGLVRIKDLNEIEILDNSLEASAGGLAKIKTSIDTSDCGIPQKLEISQEKLKNNEIVQINYTGPRRVSFYGIDKMNRIYFMLKTDKRNIGVLSIYSKDGSLKDTTSIQINFIHYSSGSHYAKIGQDNNYYQMKSDSTGFYIRRYKITYN